MATNNSIDNTSNPLASSAITIDPGASGDSYVQFDINSTGEFRVGVDDDDGDDFKISQGSALGTNDYFIVDASSGARLLPLQPAFSAFPNAAKTNVTGDGTTYTVVFDSENFDQGSDFDGTSTFTAPVAGQYAFYVSISFSDLSTSFTSLQVELNVNAGTTYELQYSDPQCGYALSTVYIATGAIHLELAASDTVVVDVTVSGSTKIIDVTTDSIFGGYLVN